MTYLLSILDKSPIPAGGTPEDAFETTRAYARLADALGFHRFWVAEHHDSQLVAGSAPELLVAHILAITSRIRVGTGGVLLRHYSAYRVAELFGVLSALAPGRVDLGIGKAGGGFPQTARALQGTKAHIGIEDKVSELDAFLRNSLPSDHPLAGAVARPLPGELPERFYLGASEESATFAANIGWGFVHAGHFDGDPAGTQRSFAAYRQIAGRNPLLAIHAIAAASTEEALKLAGEHHIYKAIFPDGHRANLGTEEAVAEYARQYGLDDYRIEKKTPHIIAGTPDYIRRELDRLHHEFGAAEIIIDSPVADPTARLKSIELIASTFQRAAA
ncbi:MAG: MsnO8 family LLM class oxidoreductase [Pseudochelatococcus sp.]|jgi:luciferase family oxidoreductase group 1|uniref:MsnO8 family LLM class oxidoreductase n=1 Tax=Pseudochelatococcus sp. TaxID=2020869 RepID=UPI003D94D8C1